MHTVPQIGRGIARNSVFERKMAVNMEDYGKLTLAAEAQTPLVASRHGTLSSILAQKRVVTRCVALVGQHGATRTTQHVVLGLS